MEKQENNNLSELEQLKQQYETLKEQFDQQEIVNDRLMKSSIKSNVDFYMRYRWRQYIFYPLGVLVALPAIQWKFAGNFSMMLFWIAYLAVSFVFEIWMLRKLHVKTLENNDLLTLSNQACGFKKLYATFSILGAVPMFILFVGVFSHASYDHLPSLGSLLAVSFVALVIYVVCGVIGIRHVTRPCDEIIRQIEASEPSANKKTGFDRKQKWFCVIMFVAFLCLDVWAYMIVASHLKLPPIWHTVKYERAANDLSTEGKLAIWEVYADTVVPEKDVPVLMENWQVGDSLVFMKGYRQEEELGMRLYILKKSTPEGPAISSMTMDGEPMIAAVTATLPRSYPNAQTTSMIVNMAPEAGRRWYQFTSKITGHRAALVMDGVVIQDWQVMHGLNNGSFFVNRHWSSMEEAEAFCERLVRQ